MSRRNYIGQWITGLAVVSTFIAFHLLFPSSEILEDSSSYPGIGSFRSEKWSQQQKHEKPLRVAKYYNSDASLDIPYLEKINKFWHVRGSTQIKNWDEIKLTRSGERERSGLVLSNGIGDNTIDDFEVVVEFAIDLSDRTKLHGDGMAIVITSLQEYMTADLHSSYAKKQFYLNHGIELDNNELMGFPRNIPGLSVVIDTYKNSANTKYKPPFISAFINDDVKQQYYDIKSDGVDSTCRHLASQEMLSVIDTSRVRIIYLESVGFLKIDIDYGFQDHWTQLFKQEKGVQLPKHPRTGERFIGVGARNGELTQTVILHRVHTYEYHWTHDQEDNKEDTFDYVEEITRYLKWELGEVVKMEEDEYTRWSLIRGQMYDADFKEDEAPKRVSYLFRTIKFLKRSLVWLGMATIAYLISVYLRVILRKKGFLRGRMKGREFPVGILGK
ncbi:Uip5p Ecym_5227 [Eremothecium cymbalariae DBVPG|uniref:L-type lectin-like domain-containing protein n=1 Tax=Eremothecium cymbalariae (strain CBS 270.75 / DBVPG 7215 / KCTC 17166 / NRRL Y-17582) TaxID=931890 RepID=I6ND53_ERECY|nr:hypothetical protein Ecym_5227 [Eremothecium cymbalariae DBVPG\